jgi:hypothetical protein
VGQSEGRSLCSATRQLANLGTGQLANWLLVRNGQMWVEIKSALDNRVPSRISQSFPGSESVGEDASCAPGSLMSAQLAQRTLAAVNTLAAAICRFRSREPHRNLSGRWASF